MATSESSFPNVGFKRFGLLLLAVASMHCQVENSGLSGAVGDAGTPGSGGSPVAYPDGEGSGGQGPVSTSGSGGAQGGFDLGIEGDLGGGDSNRTGAGGGGGNPGRDGSAGATGDAGMVGLGGAAVEGGTPAQGGADGRGGSGGAGAGGIEGSGGATGVGGSLDAEGTDVDSEWPDSSIPEDVGASEGDAAMEDAVEPDVADDLADDMPGLPQDVEDALALPVPDTADGMTADSRPVATPLWQDEFDGAADTGVDTDKWSYVTWGPGQVNNEVQRYTASRQNVFLDGDGHLVLRALRSGLQYTSGRIETNATFKFGRIEVRAKLPAGQGSFPGIVMVGTGDNWPQSGEIALMEQYGQPDQKRWFYASAYADGSQGSGDKRNMRYDFPGTATGSSDFHIYSVDWYDDRIVFQVDGNEIGRTTFGTSSPFVTTAESIVLDVALGGDMGGPIDPNAFQGDMMDMVVDYVRVYPL